MGRLVVVTLTALLGAGCAPQPPHSCSGAAIDVIVSGPLDAGADAGFTGLDGGRQPKPVCAGYCLRYRAALAEALNANVPAVACTSLGTTQVSCLPASERGGCASNSLESARTLEPAITEYLAAEWPELGLDGGQLGLDSCPCRIY